ncbi:Thromboxane-A synthase [Desmophyllum pertusum]|uniref:Thromboxane-A synthase n=1 Tax=Desmophyllum pertusum TaxID=174260 RepID=A0A9W9Y984_9CNID|nr:Thromboxane-A synthase [Desmophyllum pertusum]
MKAAFGFDTDIQRNTDEAFVAKAKGAFQVPLWVRTFSMFPFWTYLSRFVDIFPNTKYFIDLANNMLEQRAQQGSSSRRDLVQLMLEAHETTIDGVSKLNDDEIIAQSITFLLAGFETTGTYFVKHDVQDKLIEEIDKADEARGDTPLYDYVQSIGYLDQVVCEVLRLSGPVLIILRGCEEEAVYKGIRFPKGVDVNVVPYVLHRDPEVWTTPSSSTQRISRLRRRKSETRIPFCRLEPAHVSALACASP